MGKLKKLSLILLNILSTGAVFSYFGHPKLSLLIQIAAFFLTLVMSYVALFSPWIMALAVVIFLIYAVAISRSLLLVYETHTKKSNKWFFCFLATSFLVLPLANLVRPSMSFSMPHKHWEPFIYEGEHFLAQLRPKEFSPGVFVMTKRENGSIVVRRIQKIEDTNVVVELPPKDGETEIVPTEKIYGKVLYIYFSRNLDRIFNWL